MNFIEFALGRALQSQRSVSDVFDRPRSVQRSQKPEDPEKTGLENRNILSQVRFQF